MRNSICRLLKPRLVSNLSILNFSTSSVRSTQFFYDPVEAVKDIPDGATILVGGFGSCGVAENSIKALHERKLKNLTIAGITSGAPDFGIGLFVQSRQVKRLITSFLGGLPESAKMFLKGEIEVDFVPQGNLAERIRAAAAGIPAFYTPVGTGTLVQTGGIPMKMGPNGKPVMLSKEKPTREYNGHMYHLEEAIYGDYALVKAWKADRAGNLIFRKTAQNINPVMAKAAKVAIVEVEEIVEVGEIDPDQVHLPHIFVDRVVLGKSFLKPIEKMISFDAKKKVDKDAGRDRIARRAVLELKQGMHVNLGIGLPLLSTKYLKPGTVTFQSENGVLGLGPFPDKREDIDPDMTNAAREPVTYIKGASFFTTESTFDMIRGGHLDWTFLGGMQVSQHGDLANWMVPGKLVMGMGGAMDLVSAFGTKVAVLMEHKDKFGKSKIVGKCDLPVTGKNVVTMVITEMGVFETDAKKGLTLTEIGEGFTVDQVKAATDSPLNVSESLKPMAQAPELA